MNISNIINSLTTLSLNSYSEISYVADKTVEYTKALQNNKISIEEYNDLINDLKIDQIIAKTADEQNALTALSKLVNDLISLVTSTFPNLL